MTSTKKVNFHSFFQNNIKMLKKAIWKLSKVQKK